MSIQKLKDQIQDIGVSNSIISLHPKVLEPREAPTISDDGQISRKPSRVAPGILPELSSHFQLGWGALRESIPADLVSLDFLTPTIRRLLTGDPSQQSPHMLHFPHLGIVYGAVNQESLHALENHHAVDNIQHASHELGLIRPDGIRESGGEPAEKISWGIQRTGAPDLWTRRITGSGVLVGHMDTGADSAHPVLRNAITNNRVISDDGNECNRQDPCTDTESHGTHTAGIIAGRNNTGGPIVGMAPDAKLVCATVINEGDTFARLLAGLEFALAANARVLNISLGLEGFDGSLLGVFETLRYQQLLPVVAIGNNPLSSYSPGNYKTSLSVGASDEDNQVAPFSSVGHPGVGPTLCAPGKHIYSCIPGNSYGVDNGTSMAVPHIVGLAALLLSAKPKSSIDQIQEALVASCRRPEGVRQDMIGAGVPVGLDALRILDQSLS